VEHSALTALHRAAGARLRSGAGTALPLTFGDVPNEYRSGIEGCALFDETDRGRIDVHGEESAAFLQRILASDVRGLGEGEGQPSLLLSSKGKVLFAFDLFRTTDGAWLSVPAGDVARLLAALDTYLFAEKVRFTDATPTFAPLALAGPEAARTVRDAVGIDLPERELAWSRSTWRSREIRLARLAVAGSPGALLDAGPEGAADLWEALRGAGATPAGLVARDCLRVEAGLALPREDVDENVYPQEARLEAAFSLTKGCYVGQEVVAKIDTYGGLNKRLVALKISHDDPVSRGTRLHKVEDGERRDLGVVTSWAYSFVLDTGLVLAYVKRRSQAVGTRFEVGDGPAIAEVVGIPVRAGAIPVTGEFE
jgi:folate-binding protein YgfZ